MIVIRTDSGITKLDSWARVVERPFYRSEHTPNDARLAEIVGYYDLKDEIRCSLSNCHTMHKKGYLVGLSDGMEINIGHQCGVNTFDVEFDIMSKEFQNYRESEECKEILALAKNQVADWSARLEGMLDEKKGAKWANVKLKGLLSRQRVGAGIVRMLRAMLKQRFPQILVNHELTDKWEIEQRMQANPRMKYEEAKWVQISIGSLDHLEALYPENDLQELFIKSVQNDIKAIAVCEPHSMSLTQLKTLRKKANEMEFQLVLCAEKLEEAVNFLTRKNLDKLITALDDETQYSKEDKEIFHHFLDDLYK